MVAPPTAGTDPTDEVQEHAEQPVAEQNAVDQKHYVPGQFRLLMI